MIDLEGKAVLHFDGKSEAELTVNTDLIDGFVYRIPAELSVANDLKFMDLKGRTICQCASLQFDKNMVATPMKMESSRKRRAKLFLKIKAKKHPFALQPHRDKELKLISSKRLFALNTVNANAKRTSMESVHLVRRTLLKKKA